MFVPGSGDGVRGMRGASEGQEAEVWVRSWWPESEARALGRRERPNRGRGLARDQR
jgi:hypothetical protein